MTVLLRQEAGGRASVMEAQRGPRQRQRDLPSGGTKRDGRRTVVDPGIEVCGPGARGKPWATFAKTAPSPEGNGAARRWRVLPATTPSLPCEGKQPEVVR